MEEKGQRLKNLIIGKSAMKCCLLDRTTHDNGTHQLTATEVVFLRPAQVEAMSMTA